MNHLALDQQQGDRRTKQVIVYSLCALAGLFGLTVCGMAIRGVAVPDSLDRLATAAVSGLFGMLVKTGVDRVLGDEPVAVKAEEPLPVEVTDEPDEGKPVEPKAPRPSPLSKVVQTKP